MSTTAHSLLESYADELVDCKIVLVIQRYDNEDGTPRSFAIHALNGEDIDGWQKDATVGLVPAAWLPTIMESVTAHHPVVFEPRNIPQATYDYIVHSVLPIEWHRAMDDGDARVQDRVKAYVRTGEDASLAMFDRKDFDPVEAAMSTAGFQKDESGAWLV